MFDQPDIHKPEAYQDVDNLPADWFAAFGTGPVVAPRFGTIPQGFAKFAAQQPGAVAVTCADQSLSYGELDQAANRLARVLMEHGVARGDAVCLFLTRSIPMVVGIIACMRLGAAYVPQHLGVAPENALRTILGVTKSRVILTTAALSPKITMADDQVVIAIDDVMADETLDARPVAEQATPDDVCMILFTSGTTGVPNGVQVTQRNLANILLTAPGDLGIRPGLKVGQILSIAFDMAAWETLGCLSNGGTLVIRGRDIQATAEVVDVLIATPSILASLDADRCHNVQTVAVAGEPCPRPLADKWGAFCTFYNSCGPTETTIINTAIQHTPDKADLTIGKPTPNNTVYILDDDLSPLPFGEKGEMWAGGDCVTAGYLANDVLNAERYRPDPYRPGAMMFRTRDLGRWTTTGELRHCGRVDDLVKIKGFRVELDGVSRKIEDTAGCTQAATLKYDNETLVSFVCPATIAPQAACNSVAAGLPYYCVPKLVVPLDELPKTPRGKLDKRRLISMAQDIMQAAENGAVQ
ncbi:AMP-binding protein [Yoonia sp. SS1-5]|uniref:AMP-binding protein n=1 Tax=Yoonia rhodophyticola TaxID=3137370 RepID=A0AAN0NKS0_9RHOB